MEELLPRGVCAPLPVALDEQGRLDAESLERLQRWTEPAQALLVAAEEMPQPLRREALEAGCRGARPCWVEVTAGSVEELLANLELALRLGAPLAVLDPLAALDAPDPVRLFHRHLIPLFQRLGRTLPLLLRDQGSGGRLRTRDLKQLARLECVRGLWSSAGEKALGDYLKAARHFKAAHEFGAYIEDPGLLFRFYRPRRGALASLRERLNRLWLGRERPQGLGSPLVTLFPQAWREAFQAALAGDEDRLEAFQKALGGLSFPFDPWACLRTALREEGVLRSDRPPQGGVRLRPEQRRSWIADYLRIKKKLAALTQPAAPWTALIPVPAAAPQTGGCDVAGIGGAVVDEFARVASILGPDSKGRVLGRLERRAGGVMLNQLCWLSTLGFKGTPFGLLGGDAEGDFLRRELRLRGVEDGFLIRVPQPTPVSTVYVDARGERAIYIREGATQATRRSDLGRFESLLAACRLVSTEVSLLKLSVVLEVLRMARRHGKPAAVDLDLPPAQACGAQGLGSRAELARILKAADYVKASYDFAAALAPRAPASRLALALHRAWGKRKGNWVALTRGSKGCQVSDGARVWNLPACPGVKQVDTTGAGDAFMAGMLAGTLLGLPVPEAARLANACGAACVEQLGAMPPPAGGREAVLRRWKGGRLDLPAVRPVRPEEAGLDGTAFLRTVLRELERFVARVPQGAFDQAKALIREAQSTGRRVHVTGVGKPEYVAGYIASSFSSTGTPAFFLHATEASHGASGQVAPGDVVIAISNSGETAEMKAAVATVRRNGAKVIGVSGRPQSWLARNCEAFLFAGVEQEGDALNLAPRASVVAEILALSALGVELQHERKFSAEEFRAYHPGGSLGKG